MTAEPAKEPATEPNPWVPGLPGQLRAWDATALRSFMTCPRRYQYEMIEGWRKGSDHTFWGQVYHGALEVFEKERIAGRTKDEATELAFQYAVEHSGSYERVTTPYDRLLGSRWVPWNQGTLATVWLCTDEGPLTLSGKNKGKPNAARRCQNAKEPHLGDPSPEACPLCGKPTRVEHRWFWDENERTKNRYTLLRAVVWYCDEQPERDGVETFVFPDGRPAVELSFQLPLPLESPSGEPYIMCGHMDGIYRYGSQNGPRERKTTQTTLGPYYFDRYSPDIQIDLYDLATHVLYPQLDPGPVMLDATQTAAGFARFMRAFIPSTDGRREECLREIMYWIKQAEACAKAAFWPKNESACYAHGGCPFREICNKDPVMRDRYLKADFEKRPWNPLAER